jgi:Putative MetA-pathway of phenol degradation
MSGAVQIAKRDLMRVIPKLALSLVLGVCALPVAKSQDLAPRAYVISPIHSNAITLTWGFYDGGVNFNGTIPITNATGQYSVPVFSYFHSLGLFGRSASITASLPYAFGNFQGDAFGTQRSIYRSGLVDTSVRFSVNLKGGPAMDPRQFARWKQKTIIGVSLKVIIPTGQYNGTKLVNWGINRWAFKPEVGYSRRRGHWLIDGYGGAWFYTTNPAFYSLPAPMPQSEEPIGSLEGHLSHDFGDRTWVSLDGNFWWGGITSLNGIRNAATKQTGSRLGGTASLRLSKHQSVKISYSDGTYIRFGGNYQSVSFAWQYTWLGRK